LGNLGEALAKYAPDIAKILSDEKVYPKDITLLQIHYNNLKQAGYNQADTIQFSINKLAV
jgi:hypothetical protein